LAAKSAEHHPQIPGGGSCRLADPVHLTHHTIDS
jgi:hypothetical protein